MARQRAADILPAAHSPLRRAAEVAGEWQLIKRGAVSGNTGVASAFEFGHQLGVEFLFDGGVLGIAGDVFDLVGVVLQNEQLLAWTLGKSVVVVPFPLGLVPMLDDYATLIPKFAS